MATKTKRRKRFTPEQRAKILETAKREKLTAVAVKQRFGVSAVTYYLWRKKAGLGRRRRSRLAVAAAQDGLGNRVRGAVEFRMREVLPSLIDAEINRYLDAALGSRRRRSSV